MDQNTKLLGTGAVGALLSMLCCVTPLLVAILGAVGLSAYVAKLDYVLISVFVASLGLIAFAIIRRRRQSCPAKELQTSRF
jgi:mercuric ion transport protein